MSKYLTRETKIIRGKIKDFVIVKKELSKLTPEEKEELEYYIKAGSEIKMKLPKDKKDNNKKYINESDVINKATIKDIETYLSQNNRTEDIENFRKIKKSDGFLKAKSWFKNEYPEYINKKLNI